jgi:flagellar hook-length control protein FliK
MHGAATPHILLARNLADLVKAGQTGPVELSLSPQELGRLRISLSPDGEGLHVAVQVERNETLDLLRRNTDMLLQEIRAQGFSGASFSFSGWSGEKTAASSGSSPATGMPATSPEPSVFRPAPSTGLDLRL